MSGRGPSNNHPKPLTVTHAPSQSAHGGAQQHATTTTKKTTTQKGIILHLRTSPKPHFGMSVQHVGVWPPLPRHVSEGCFIMRFFFITTIKAPKYEVDENKKKH